MRLETFDRTKARVSVALLVILAAAIGAGVAGIAARAGTSALRITVTEHEYSLTLSRRAVKPGRVTLVVVNAGKVAHSLAIHGPKLSRRIAGTIPPGGRRTIVVRLASGTYSIWCPVPGHAALGMKTTLSVKKSGTTTTTGTTTGSGGGGGWG